MNKTEFVSLIDNPKNLDKSHITALRNIAADFPYFQASHILLSKALFNENHYEFEKHLKSTALIVSDRELLYKFLHDIYVENFIDEQNFVSSPSQEIIELTEEIITQKSNEIIFENTDEQVAEQASDLNFESEKIIENSIDETIIIDKVEPEIFQHQNEKHSFTEWLLLDRKVIEKIKIEEKYVEPEIEKTDVSDVAKPSSNVHEFESILDKFIRENPSISRPKAEFYNPANMAKQSNEDDDDLATETLANIYYKQGAYKKAIRTYEKLCLIYPHKMHYFADLIQKIKQENKND